MTFVELVFEVDASVEVAIRVPPDEHAVPVQLLDIRSPVEVDVERDPRDMAVTIVGAPDIGPPVAVPVLGAHVAAGAPWPHWRSEQPRDREEDDQRKDGCAFHVDQCKYVIPNSPAPTLPRISDPNQINRFCVSAATAPSAIATWMKATLLAKR